MTDPICTFPDCGKPHLCVGLCRGHYSQQWLGKPLTPLRVRAKRGEPIEWLTQSVLEATRSCVEWPFAKGGGGYGIVAVDGKNRPAHVVALDLVMPWHPPYGPNALHSCDNPPCVNPDHLSWGTQAENNRQMWERGRARGYLGSRVATLGTLLRLQSEAWLNQRPVTSASLRTCGNPRWRELLNVT